MKVNQRLETSNPISRLILILLAIAVGIPMALQGQIWSDNFESYGIGDNPLATSARNSKIVDGTDTIGTGNAVRQFHESSTTGVQYNLAATAEGSVGIFYASLDVMNADPSVGEAGRGIWIGTGLWSGVDGSGLDLKALSTRHFSLRIMSGEDPDNPGFAVVDFMTNENLREFQTFDSYALTDVLHVEFFVNDDDANSVEYTRPDTDEMDTLEANSVAVYINKVFLISAPLHPDLSVGDMTIGRFGTYTGSKDRGDWHVDNIYFDSAFPAPLSYTVDPLAATLPAAGGTANINVSVSRPDGEWEPTGGDDWISYDAGISTGSGELTVTASENTSLDPRETSVSIAGIDVTIIQAGIDRTMGSISYRENFETYSVGDNPLATSARNAKIVDAGETIASGQAVRMIHETSTTGLQYNLTATDDTAMQTLYASMDLFNFDPAVGEAGDGIWIGTSRWNSADGSSLGMKSYKDRHFSLRIMSMEDPDNPGKASLDVTTDGNMTDSQAFTSYDLNEVLHLEFFVNDNDSDVAKYYRPDTLEEDELAANSFAIFINGTLLISAELRAMVSAGNTTIGRFGTYSGTKDRTDFQIDNVRIESEFPIPTVPSDLPWEADGLALGDSAVSAWFGSFELATGGWLNHSELGWIHVGLIEDSANMWIWSLYHQSWLWSNRASFPIVYDLNDNRWIYYFIIPDTGVYLYDYSLGSWVVNP